MEQKVEKAGNKPHFRVDLYYKGIGFVLTTDMPLPSNDSNKTDDQRTADLMAFLQACREKEALAVRFISGKPFPPYLKSFCPCVYFGRISEYIPHRVYPDAPACQFLFRPSDVVINDTGKIEAGRENLLSLLNPPTQEALEARYVKKYGCLPQALQNLGTHGMGNIVQPFGGNERGE